ncbi:MAG: penicillin-binding protein activator [Proteobacteria bacterium]|nr:penicillin-binding protein activator [Pseudomonadota bacterium]
MSAIMSSQYDQKCRMARRVPPGRGAAFSWLFVAVLMLIGATGCAETTVKEEPQFRKFEPATGRVESDASKPAAKPENQAGAQASADSAAKPVPAVPAVTDPLAPTEVRVAILLPLTGANAALGQAMLDAAQLSMFELAGDSFVLMPFDTGSTDQGARQAATLAIERNAQLILGPLTAGSVQAVAPVARAAGVQVIAFSNSHEVAGNGIFILGFVPRQQVDAVVGYAASEGAARFAALVPDDSYGRSVVDAVRESAQARGATLVRARLYDTAAADYTDLVKDFSGYDARHGALLAQRRALAGKDDEISRQALRRLERLDTIGEAPFDALVLPESGERLRTMSALLSYFDIDVPAVKLLGLRSWDLIPNLGTEPALIGAWFAGSPVEERNRFNDRFKRAFGRTPPRLATLAYDATALAAVLSHAEGGPDYSAPGLMDRNGFLGVDGIFRLNADGIAERVFTIYEVTRDGVKVRRSAPTSFTPLTN